MIKPAPHTCRWCKLPSGDAPLVLESGHYVHPACSFTPEAYPIVTLISFPGSSTLPARRCDDCSELLAPSEVVTCEKCRADRNEARAYRLTSTGKTIKAVR